jgi:hypothetical protein
VLALVALVLSVGLLDSINPSTIGPALYLATGRDAHRSLAGFTAGVFAVYLLGGLVLALGPGQIALAALPRPHGRATHLVELGVGAAALLLAAALWIGRERVARRVVRDERRIGRSSMLVGAGIMAVELPTAVPYFAVIAAVVGSGRSVPTQIALLVLFNGAFVVPLLAIVGLRALAGTRGERLLAALRARLHRYAAILIPALVLLVAGALIAIGAIGLAGD